MAVTGRFVLLVAAGLVPLLFVPQSGLIRLWWVGCLLLLVVDVGMALPPKKLRAQRDLIEPVRLGDSTHSVLRVTNPTTRRVKVQVRDAWQPSAGARGGPRVLTLFPGRTESLKLVLTPTRRGDRLTDRVTFRVFGPLGLGARQRSVDVPGTARALPPFTSRRHLPGLLAELRQLDGRSAVRVRGQGTEFDSLRDYVEGDDVRSIDWRATARRSQVVVRTWRPERDRHIVIVLDTSRTSAGRILDMPRLDSAMDAALLLSALTSKAGDRVEVIMGDRVIRSQVRADRKGNILNRLVNEMAPLEPALVEADWPRLVGAVTSRVRQRSLVVLLTPLEPAAVEESLLPVLPTLTARHRVVLASVQDPALTGATLPAVAAGTDLAELGTEQVYSAAAAEQFLVHRGHTAAVLERMGVDVLDESPDQLPLTLCRHYLALKARGLL